MIKTQLPDAQKFDVQRTTWLKTATNGRGSNDFNTFLKQAGGFSAGLLRGVHALPGEELVHHIALGAFEKFGENRNADAFMAAACREFHATFVKHAKIYRDHKSSDPEKSYGIIKASGYNEEMARIEIISALNATKEAARRNQGLVADREIEKLARNEDYPVSMACGIDYDVCSSCHNKAKTRFDYCTEATCPHGGCRSNLGKIASDGHKLYVDNPHPIWKDLSGVGYQADRIAYTLGRVKAASGAVMGGAEVAELFGLWTPDEFVQDPTVERFRALARKAAAVEGLVKPSIVADRPNKTASIPKSFDGSSRRAVLASLATDGHVLSLSGWLDVVAPGTPDEIKSAIASVLPGSFARLADSYPLAAQAAADPAANPAGNSGISVKMAAESCLDLCVPFGPKIPAESRAATVYGKRASTTPTDDPAAMRAAERYAAYTISAAELSGRDEVFTAVARRNLSGIS